MESSVILLDTWVNDINLKIIKIVNKHDDFNKKCKLK